jgi:hypothetical protein
MTFRGLSEGKRVARRLVKIMERRWYYRDKRMFEEWKQRTLKLFRKTKVPCSCWMCSYEKKMHIPTRQEKRAMEKEREFLKEINTLEV